VTPLQQHLLIDQLTDCAVGWYKGDDGAALRYALLWPREGEPRGTILVVPGRREFIEKKFPEVITDFLERGYRVIAFEWRGQGLSHRSLTGAKRQRDHVTDFDVHMHDLSGFYERVVKPNTIGPLILCGHSMGSHLLLRWMVENPDIPVTGAILTAPMLALAGHLAHSAANLVSWSALKLGYGDDYASAQHDYNGQDMAFTGNPLTHDPVRFASIEKYFKSVPEMAVGGVTWEWLHAAIKSMHVTQKKAHLDLVRKPILTITGSHDHVTPVSEIGRFLHLLPNAENVIVEGAYHDVMNEVPAYRAEAWRHVDGFLGRL